MMTMLWAVLSEPVMLVVGAVAAHPLLAASGALVAVSGGALLGRWRLADRDA